MQRIVGDGNRRQDVVRSATRAGGDADGEFHVRRHLEEAGRIAEGEIVEGEVAVDVDVDDRRRRIGGVVDDLELGGAGTDDTRTFNLREIREQAERQAIVRAMSHVGGKISQASELLGVSRPTMYDLIKKYNLK